MPLLVVPLAPEDAPLLTVEELDALAARERVLFERPEHPLVERLLGMGVAAGPFDDEPVAGAEGWALVADPASPRVVELARAGADVLLGPALLPDATTGAHAAPLVRRAARSLTSLVAIMARLRSVDGCPWDRDQTHESLRVHLLEETHEVLDALDRGFGGAELEEELGDLLLQVAFHAQLAAEDGRFDIAGVADAIVGKLVRRHPHVFAGESVADAADVVARWERIKADEKAGGGSPEGADPSGPSGPPGDHDPFAGIPASLPALAKAAKLQKRAAAGGFRPDVREAGRRVEEALARSVEEGASPASIGDALFWLVAIARAEGIDAEGALARAGARFAASWRSRPEPPP